MKNLIQFIVQNSFPIVFLLLQALSFYIIYNYNYFQQSALYRSGTEFGGSISERKSQITDYINLAEANTRLANENAELHNKELSSFVIVNKEFRIINDSLHKVKYRYAPAKVINSTYTKTANFLTLDKGSVHGFKENMGVSNDQGLIGTITSVSKNFSIVLPIIHPKATFSVMVKDKHYFGLLKWDGKKAGIAKMTDVSNHAQLSVGDSIITRETSIFPEGIPVGKIMKFEKVEGSNFLNIDIELFADYTKVYQVYGIENLMREEQLELEKTEME